MATVRLLGEHISYSASPAMQSAAFAALGLDHRYELADVSAADLSAAIAALRDAEVLGANVTVPHKAAIMPLLDEVDALSRRADAVNTIVNRDGTLIGTNTDVPAIADEIQRLNNAPRVAVILGAGGAARAVAIALTEIGAPDAVMVSRANWSELPTLLADADLLVNATPIGTNTDESPIDPALLHPNLVVLDLVYRPSPTRLVRDARECGLHAQAGAGILLGQGWRSLEAWLGHPITNSLKQAMADALTTELGVGADV
jgi:shikimate dehydrogenase